LNTNANAKGNGADSTRFPLCALSDVTENSAIDAFKAYVSELVETMGGAALAPLFAYASDPKYANVLEKAQASIDSLTEADVMLLLTIPEVQDMQAAFEANMGYCAWWKTGTCPLSAATTIWNTCREYTAAPAPDDDDDPSAPPTKEEMNAMLRFQSLFANVMALVLAILSYLNFQRSEERTGCCGAPCCECGCGPPPKGGGCTNVNWAKVFYIQSGLSCLGATSTAVMIAAPTDDYFILVISFLSALVTVILAWIATAPLLDNWEKEVTAKKIAKGGDVCYKLSLSKGTYCICPCLGLKNVFRLALVMEMILICVAFAAFSPHVPFSFDCLLPNNNGTCVTATE